MLQGCKNIILILYFEWVKNGEHATICVDVGQIPANRRSMHILENIGLFELEICEQSQMDASAIRAH